MRRYSLLAQEPTMNEPSSGKQILKVVASIVAGGSFLLISAFIMIGTILAITLATPLAVIFSPVLVPATITAFLIIAGFLGSGGFGIAALTVLTWIYRYITGKHPLGSKQLEYARMRLAGKAHEIKGRAEQFRQEQVTGTQ
ncbi:oleosin L-like [Impatiens glandulifera]|uniref:oleosin L-like n=1 Tax=Impatiens glandulifera TaxID=253017 RepID=UPI001FB09457|nr:oleosin L-like [Impatiens glandulifera]